MTYRVTIRKAETSGQLKAYADVVLDESYCVTGFRILEGKNGLFVSMPQRKREDSFRDTFFPIHSEARQLLVEAILAAYEA